MRKRRASVRGLRERLSRLQRQRQSACGGGVAAAQQRAMTISLNKLLWLCGASFTLSAGTLVLAVLRSADARKPSTAPVPAEDAAAGLRQAERARVAMAAQVARSMVRVSTSRERPGMRTVRTASGERREETMIQARPLVGAGFLISAGGRIATNAHVVAPLELSEGEQLKITVLLEGEAAPRQATLIGTDDVADLAILQVARKEGETFVPLEFADSRTLQPGRDATAFGYPFQLPLCSTAGRVSNAAWHHGSHPIPFILLDAKINPGNSGGPVVDLDGKVMGVITRVTASAQTPGGGGAFGMAIPGRHVQEVLDLLESEKRRGWLGFMATEKVENGTRVLVAGEVAENAPAAKAGLQRDDAILSILGHRVVSFGEFRLHQRSIVPGQKVALSVQRGDRQLDLTIDAQAPPALPRPDSRLIPLLGLRVRDMRAEEKQRLGIEAGVPGGVVLTGVEPESRFLAELQAGDRILLVREPSGMIHQLADAADLRDRVLPLRSTGGQIYVQTGDEERWLPFLPTQ